MGKNGPKQPMQPLEFDAHGVMRFRRNAIVDYLLEKGGIDMNQIANQAQKGIFSRNDRMQFAQLIGYSLSGYGELPYTTEKSYAKARQKADKVRDKAARGG